MELQAAIKGDLNKIVEKKNRNIISAANRGISKASFNLRNDMVSQTRRAGLGDLSNTWFVRVYDKKKRAKFPTGLVYTKAPHIMEGFEIGGIRKPKRGQYIPIPTENVPKARNKKYTPANWPVSFPELYMAKDSSGKAYLVGQTIYKTTSKGRKTIRKASSRTQSQAETVIYFFLVKQTRHTQRISFSAASHAQQKRLKLYIGEELYKLERK